MNAGDELDVGERDCPEFVRDEPARERWRICERIATALSEQNEPGGSADRHFVYAYSRWLFASAVPTGSPNDPHPS